jgi:hypothetical protein
MTGRNNGHEFRLAADSREGRCRRYLQTVRVGDPSKGQRSHDQIAGVSGRASPKFDVSRVMRRNIGAHFDFSHLNRGLLEKQFGQLRWSLQGDQNGNHALTCVQRT